MIWMILAALGIPLWVCAIGVFGLHWRNRYIRNRPGDVPVCVLHPGKTRW